MTKPTQTHRAPEEKISGAGSEPERSKRPYRAPVLTEYGHIGKLTRGGSGLFAEFGGHRQHKCL